MRALRFALVVSLAGCPTTTESTTSDADEVPRRKRRTKKATASASASVTSPGVTASASAAPATSVSATKAKGPNGNVSIGAVAVAGGKIANASKVVGRMKGRFRACYRSGLRSNPTLAGSVVLTAKIDAQGDVVGVGGGAGPALTAIVSCLKGVAAAAAFSPPDSGAAVVSIPITLTIKK